MCWSGEASLVMGAAGIAGASYAAYKKEPPAIWVTLIYFSLMELLQAYTYSVIDQCNNPANQLATLLGYLHITFQVFFINAISMHFIPNDIRQKIQRPVYIVCFIASILLLIRLYPFSWAPPCQIGDYLCGKILCSVSGSWHIAWHIPFNVLTPNIYMFAAFIMPLLYGSWRTTLYHLIAGVGLSYLLTNGDPNEFPAVWCLLSIGFLLIVIDTPIRQILYVKQFWLWNIFKKNKPTE